MPFQQAKSIRYYTFESYKHLPIQHAIFTRTGGVSEGPFASLNVGSTVGDDLDKVVQNVDLVFEALGRPRDSLFDSWLVHGTDYLVAEAPRTQDGEFPPKADIILTDKKNVSLFMRYADCLPLLFYDPIQHAVGLAHAGWKGSVQNVAGEAVSAMERHFGCKAADLHVAIGPGISTRQYAIGPEVVTQVRGAFGKEADRLLPSINGSTHFDLMAANRLGLKKAGVDHVESADLCTASNTQDWFSHRAESGRTGRYGVLLALMDK